MIELFTLPLAELHGPMPSVFGCVMFLFFPAYFMYLMNRSVMGDIGCSSALLLCFTCTYLLAVIWRVQDPVAHYGAVLGILSLVIGMPILSKIAEKMNDKAFEDEQIEVCYQQIKSNPQNAMAAFRLAKILHEKGEKDYAIAIGKASIQYLPKQYWRNEHMEFERWMRARPHSNATEVDCVACSRKAPASALICPHCLGSIHLDRTRKGSLVHNKRAQKIISVWASLMIVVFSIPSLGQLPPFVSIPAILVMCAVAIWAVVTAFGLGFQKS